MFFCASGTKCKAVSHVTLPPFGNLREQLHKRLLFDPDDLINISFSFSTSERGKVKFVLELHLRVGSYLLR